MKKVLGLLSILMLSLVLVACGGEKAATGSEIKKIYVGTNAEFEPFEYREGDQIVGFDIDLINEIAKEAKLDIEIKDMAFDGLIPALQSKKIDLIIAGMTVTPDREKFVSFSTPYYKSKQVIVTKNDLNIKSFDDLKGKKVGVMLGFTSDVLVSKIDGTKSEKFDATYAAILALKADKVDAVVLDYEPAKRYTKAHSELKIEDVVAEEENSAIAVRKEDKELLEKINKALETIHANGTYDKLIEKYFK